MKILFSPSEAKISGGKMVNFDKNLWIFPDLYGQRISVLNRYNEFIKSANQEMLSKLFGLKKPFEIEYYSEDIFLKPVMKAVLRYLGVAYKHLNYRSLDECSKEFIDKNCIIFSNLYGPILAGDLIVDYKLKQGETIGDFCIENFYKQNFSNTIDEFLDHDILDLRAGFYEKFYIIKKPYFTIKFLKNGKVLSHFAKAYRGEVLKTIAINKIETIEEFLNIDIEDLKINKIIKKGEKTEITFDIF